MPETKDEAKANESFPEVLSSYPIVASYEGEKSDGGSFEGTGTITFENGAIYNGEVRRSTMHGIGEYTWPSGKSFKGTFRKNSIEEGQGVYKWGTHTYDGDVSAVNGMRNGFGKFDCTLPSGGTLAYEGDWKDGRRHGSGKQVLTRKSETTVYEGVGKTARPMEKGK